MAGTAEAARPSGGEGGRPAGEPRRSLEPASQVRRQAEHMTGLGGTRASLGALEGRSRSGKERRRRDPAPQTFPSPAIPGWDSFGPLFSSLSEGLLLLLLLLLGRKAQSPGKENRRGRAGRSQEGGRRSVALGVAVGRPGGRKEKLQMSSRNVSSERRPGRSVHYDEVYVDSPSQDDTERDFPDAEQILNGDPLLPPPPLPLQPPFGPEFYPSESEEPAGNSDLKPVRKFIPDSWKNFFKGKKDDPEWHKPVSTISSGVECSPPSSPTLTPVRTAHASAPSSYQDPYGGSGGTYNSRKEAEAMLPSDPYSSLERHTQTVQTYSEKVEAFNLRYSYMKSWAGLLRILGVVELLLGAAVFACVTAYIHKDNEWYNMYGYSQPYGYGASSTYGGYYYSGPKTPFVLVVAALVWIVTIILLVLGMSMYYRTILLDSNWWPLTEFGINVALFILYMSAAIVYVNDANRGGLCYYRLFNTPMNASFCRIEGGQTAAIIFLFVTMIVYLIGAIVCLKLWRHESARKHREFMDQQMKTQSITPKRMYEDENNSPKIQINSKKLKPVEMKPELLNGYIPAGHIPKPIVMPDYLAKYPAIRTNEERDRYKAVFNDQFSEYKELSAEVQAVLKKFDELDALMRKLPRNPGNTQEHERIANVLQQYKKKKNDPTFLEKKERCEYLKNKLSHIKQRIQEYDKVMNWKA